MVVVYIENEWRRENVRVDCIREREIIHKSIIEHSNTGWILVVVIFDSSAMFNL